MFWRWGVLPVIVLLCGCSMPRIIVLNDPLDARQHNDLGVAYEQRGEFDLAGREYRRAAALDDKWARPLINRGNIAARQGAWPSAAADYREALKRQPDNGEAMNNLAWALLQGQRPAEALPWALQAVAAAENDPRCWDTLADVYLKMGQADAARQAIHRGLALQPPPALRSSLEAKLPAE